jgi:hypothetical protein
MGAASLSIAVTSKRIWMRKDRMGGIPNRVIPAKAGTQSLLTGSRWVPAK